MSKPRQNATNEQQHYKGCNQWLCGRSWAYLPGQCSAQREIGGDGSSQGHRRGQGTWTDTLREHSTVPGQLETRVETETHVRFNWNFLPSFLFPWESTCFRCWESTCFRCWCWCCWCCWFCWCCWCCWCCCCWYCCCCCSNKCCIIVWHHHVCEWFSIGRGHLSNYLWVSTDHSACTCQSAKTTLEERLSEKNEAHPQLHDLTRLLDRVLVKAMCITLASSTLHQCRWCRCMHFFPKGSD